MEERVAQAVISIGIAFESVRPTLDAGLREQFMLEYGLVVGVGLGEPFDHKEVA